MADEAGKYDAGSIKVLEGLEAVRKRPGMYVGGSGKDALHHLVWEVVDNSVDEALAGYGDRIEVTRDAEEVISVRDYGRGIPVGINPTTGKSTVETVLTVLHAGGKFDENSYKVSGGLHGVGVSVVTALSRWIEAEVCRDGTRHRIRIEDGGKDVVEPLHEVGGCRKRGTLIRFLADDRIFGEVAYDDGMIMDRLRKSSFLVPGVTFTYTSPDVKAEFHSEVGLADYVRYSMEEDGVAPLTEVFSVDKEEEHGDARMKKSVRVKFAMAYGDTHRNRVLSFVNNVPTPDGGPHENQMFLAIKRAIEEKAEEKKLGKKLKGFSAEDIKEGLYADVAVYVYEPEFEGQTKGRLGKNTPVAKATFSIIRREFSRWLEENPQELKKIVRKIEISKRAREASERSREAIRKSESDSMVGVLPTKLADCRSRKPEECEIFFVEGDSAGGGLKEVRDSRFQAVLPLRGKTINPYKNDLRKVLNNEEVGALVTAMGAGIGNECDPSKARYHKNIILTDADVDGGHIGFLLVLTFMKLMRPLVEAGYLYVVIPPLHRAVKAGRSEYFYSDQERLDFFVREWEKAGKGEIPMRNGAPDLGALSKGWTLTRFKGLGEMNPDQLEEIAANPETRRLKQLVLPEDESAEEVEEILEMLGGEGTEVRRWFLSRFTKEIEVDV